MTRKKIILTLITVAIISIVVMAYLSGLTFESLSSTKKYTDTEKSLSLRYPKQYYLQVHGGAGVSIGTQASSTNRNTFESVYSVVYKENKAGDSPEAHALDISCAAHIELQPECKIVKQQSFITDSKMAGTIVYVDEVGKYKDERGVPIIFNEVYGPFYIIPQGSYSIVLYPTEFTLEKNDLLELQKIAESIKPVK